MGTYIDLSRPIPGAPHIGWYELTVTEHRTFLEQNRTIDIELQASGESLARMLETVRSWFGRPLLIHSAYRCPPLNRAIGGSSTSQHMLFQAADFHISGVSFESLFQRIRVSETLHWGQLILEGPDPANGLSSWVHLSLGAPWRRPENCGEVLYYATRTGRYTRLNPADPALV